MSAPKEPASSSALSGRHVLLGVTGGIAAYKSCHLTRLFTGAGATVQVAMTKAATRFVGPDTFAALSARPVYTDLFEEQGSVLHVRLANEADVAVVAPATANVLAKLALGFADDLLTSTLLEVTSPVLVAPAMHTGMFQNPATQQNIRLLAQNGVRIVGPSTGALAARDEGLGRMAEPEEIFAEAESAVGRGKDLRGMRVIVTAGPTWEPIDPVRFVGNRSSGKMGFAVATEAALRGADVVLVLGPGTGDAPFGIRVLPVTTAEEMREAVLAEFERADAVVMAAAVADFRPQTQAPAKIKRAEGPPELRFVPNPDILAELAARKTGQVLVGFAAETEDLEGAGREKLDAKGLEFIVVNEVGREGTGFGSDTNHAMIVSRTGEDEPLRVWTKSELARAVCDRLSKPGA